MSTCKCFWTRRMFIYVLWFTFNIIVRYFVCITTAKAFRVRRHKQGKEYYNYLISWCCFLRHERCAWCYSTRRMFINYGYLQNTRQLLHLCRDSKDSQCKLTLENIFHMNTSLCCRFLSSLLFHCHCCWCFRLKSSYLHRWMQFQAPDRMVAVYVYLEYCRYRFQRTKTVHLKTFC